MQKIKVVKASERVVVERSKPVRTVERVKSWVDETRREIQLKREADTWLARNGLVSMWESGIVPSSITTD